MVAQLDVTWVPSATDIALAGVIGFAESATRKSGYWAGSYPDLWQWPVARLIPQAKSPCKISTTTTSPGAPA